MTLKLGMQHWGIWLYLVISSDDPWWTLASFTVSSVSLGLLDFCMAKRQNSGYLAQLKGSGGAYRIVCVPLFFFVGIVVINTFK